MSAVGLETIDHTVQLTHIWINELEKRLLWDDKARTYRLLKAVLRALRDWLPISEAANLAAQLPTLLRGAYYEHWQPSKTPVRARSRADFLARVAEAIEGRPIQPADAVSTVFGLLSSMIAAGEVENVCRSLPADLQDLWLPPQPGNASPSVLHALPQIRQ